MQDTAATVKQAEQVAAGYTAHFATSPGYLDFAHFGPPSMDVLKATSAVTRQAMTGLPADAAAVVGIPAATRAQVATLLGTPTEQVTLTPNVSTALFQAAYALPGKGTVLARAGDFPSNTRAWERAAERGGPQLRLVPSTAAPAVADYLDEDVTAVTVSAVDYRTGERVDLPRLREAVGDRLLIVDAIQGFGVIDADWRCADVLAVGGQKWLRAGWGCGFMACSARALDRLGHGLSGWTGVADPILGSADQLPVRTADRFTITNPSPPAAAGLAAALQIVAVTGIAAIEAVIGDRVGRVNEVLARHGAVSLDPNISGPRAGIVSVTFPDGPHPARVAEALGRLDMVVTQRADYLRVSVHASTPADIAERLGAGLAEAQAA